MAQSNMRGLTVFISDIRNCQSKEAEKKRVDKEMAHIRKKFKSDTALSSYDKKKYTWKLLYIYMLGYEVDFGHMEAINLIGSSKYSEKQVGYLATSLLLNEESELLRLIINAIRNDIVSKNENFMALALTSVANMGGRDFAEALAPEVEKIVMNNTYRPSIRKKAILCMLRLYRKQPEVLSPETWTERLIELMGDRDLGVVTSALSMANGIVSINPRGWDALAPAACKILSRLLVDREYGPDYTYYGIPSPWIQVKALRLLQYYPPTSRPEDEKEREKERDKEKRRSERERGSFKRNLIEVLKQIIATTDVTKNVNKNNASHAVLFEAINLVVQMDSKEGDLVSQGINLLGRFIAVREPNIKYLGLETMGRVAVIPDAADHVRKHQQRIVESLRDADISIRRRALDLLYAICDASNGQEIVGELLDFLVTADFAIREELVLKIAILAEKFAPRLAWYVDVILQLISLAGDFVSDVVWHRVVMIVTNNEALQQYAAATVFKNLEAENVHEKMLTVGSYLLGEFGHLISDQPQCSPANQFGLLHRRFPSCTGQTRAMLLSTYVKFMNVYPELKETILPVFESHKAFFDVEIQQRACEYAAFGRAVSDNVVHTVWEMMPAFPDRESALLKRLAEKHAGAQTWTASFEDEQKKKGEAPKAPETPKAPPAEANLLDVSGPAAVEPDNPFADPTPPPAPAGAPELSQAPSVRTRARPAPATPTGAAAAAAAPSQQGALDLLMGGPVGPPPALAPPEEDNPFASPSQAPAQPPAPPPPMGLGMGQPVQQAQSMSLADALRTPAQQQAPQQQPPSAMQSMQPIQPMQQQQQVPPSMMHSMQGMQPMAMQQQQQQAPPSMMHPMQPAMQSMHPMAPAPSAHSAPAPAPPRPAQPQSALVDLLGPPAPAPAPPPRRPAQPAQPAQPAAAAAPSGMEAHPELFRALCTANDGILYEDDVFQVALKMEFHCHQGRILLFYGNKAPVPLSSFRTQVPHFATVEINCGPAPPSIAPRFQAQQGIMCQCLEPFPESPKIDIMFQVEAPTGAQQRQVSLRLPIVLSKFNEPLAMPPEEFLKRWSSPVFSEAHREHSGAARARTVDMAAIERVFGGLKLGVVKGVEAGAAALHGVALFFAHNAQNPQQPVQIPVMARVETNAGALAFRLTVKTGHQLVTAALYNLLHAQLAAPS
eukprot:tig00021312_g20087.t1